MSQPGPLVASAVEAVRTLGLSNVQAGDIGDYHVIVTNTYGSATSSVVTLKVSPINGGTLGPTVTFSANHVQFLVSGSSGFRFVVEASTDLTDWVPVMTNTAPFPFSDPFEANPPQRFYRSVYRP